jgi:hypothetical protein
VCFLLELVRLLVRRSLPAAGTRVHGTDAYQSPFGGTPRAMTDPRLADHATGVELQLEELVVQRETALREGWSDEADALEPEIAQLQLELADTAEQVADEHYQQLRVHDVDTADHLADPAA